LGEVGGGAVSIVSGDLQISLLVEREIRHGWINTYIDWQVRAFDQYVNRTGIHEFLGRGEPTGSKKVFVWSDATRYLNRELIRRRLERFLAVADGRSATYEHRLEDSLWRRDVDRHG
jgi:hypothetical protein